MFGELNPTSIAQSNFDTFKKSLDENIELTPENKVVISDIDKKRQWQAEIDQTTSKNSSNGLDTGYAFGKSADYSPEKFAWNTKNYNIGELYEELSDGSLHKKFDTYTPGINNYEDHAQKQTLGDKAWNGLVKFADTIGTTVVGGTVGAVYGIGEAISEGRFASLYDNDFTRDLDLHQEKVKLDYGHYDTIEDKDDEFFEKLNNANFWFDDVAQGVAFTAGALATEGIWAWATGGTSLATVGARWGANVASKTAKVASIVGQIADKTVDATKYLDDMTRVAKAGKQLITAPATLATTSTLAKLTQNAFTSGIWGGRIGEGANVLRGMVTSAGYEAGFEARAFMNESRKSYMATFEAQNGRKPTKDEISEFENALDNSANGLFAYNVGIVGMSNLAQFGNIMNISLPKTGLGKILDKKIFGVGLETAETGVRAIKATTLQKGLQIGYSLGKGAVVEGAWEEGMQSVGTHTAETLMKASYDKNLSGENYDLTKAFGESLGKTYGTREGLNEVFTGMVVGALTGNVMGMTQTFKAGDITINHEFADKNKRNKTIEETFSGDSNYSGKNAIDNMIMANRVLQSKKVEESAERKGDFLGGELARGTSLFANFSKASNLDYLDEHVTEMSKQVELLSEKDLSEAQGITVEQARELKDSMKEELAFQANSFKKVNEFSKYMIGSKISQGELEVAIQKIQEKTPDVDPKLVRRQLTNQLREALSYELYMGETSYRHGEDMLKSFQNEVQNILGNTDIQSATDIVNVINNSTKATQKDLFKTKNELKTTKEELKNLDKEQRVVETVVANARTPEARQEAVSKLNDLVIKRDELIAKEQELTDNWNVLFDTAKIQNPYNKANKQVLTSDDIFNAEKTIENTLGSIDQLSQDKALRLKTLLREYEKSISASKKYSERTNQMMSLKGDLGIFGKLLASKTPRQSTIEMIQGLLDTHFDQSEIEKEAFDNAIQDVSLKQPESEGVSIKPQEEKDKLNIVDYIKEQIKKNPYIFENIGEDFEQALPTNDELDEYYDLYEKSEIEQVPLTKEEIERFSELNNKLANWQLLESMDFEGVTLADLIKQQASISQEASKVETSILTEDDLDTMEESVNDEINQERRFDVLQTPQNVFVQVKDGEVLISHLTPKALLEIAGQTQAEVSRNNETEIVNIEDLNDYVELNDIISFGNTNVKYIKGGRLVMYEDDFQSLNLPIRSTKSGYSLVYDSDGKPMKSDFKDVNTYSPNEISKLKSGDELTMVVDLEDEFNSNLLTKSEQEIFDNLKISFEDNDGNKVADLKANYQKEGYDTDDAFLEIRKKAVEIVKESLESRVTVGYVPVSTIFLGAPGTEINTQTGAVINKEIVTNLVEDYGYWDGQKLVLKGSTKPRTDFLKGLNKQLPVVVVKEGNMLVAYPVSLNTVDKMLGNEIMEKNLPKAQLATELNQQLKLNGVESSLFFISSDNTNMFQLDGKTSAELELAVEALNKVQDKVDYTKLWFENSHTKENLKEEASINVDMNSGQMFLSPKVVVNLSDWTEVRNTVEKLSEDVVELISLKNRAIRLGDKDAMLLSDNTLKYGGASFKFVFLDGNLYTQPINNSKWIDGYLNATQEDEKAYYEDKVKTLTTNRGDNFLDEYYDVYQKIAELESDPFVKEEYNSWLNLSEEKQEESEENTEC
jgi:hypothetical protein